MKVVELNVGCLCHEWLLNLRKENQDSRLVNLLLTDTDMLLYYFHSDICIDC